MTDPNPKGVVDMRPPEHRTPFAQPRQATTPSGQPYVDPGALPAVGRYIEGMAARSAARRGVPLDKYSVPVGGGQGPSIPRLDGAHATGATMSAQAEHVNSPPMHQQFADAAAQRPLGSIVEPPLISPGAASPSLADQARGLNLRPTDLLPPAAQQDPNFRKGNGAMFAVAQPALAARYGVVRGGQLVTPQQLASESSGPAGPLTRLRPETMRGLQDLQELQQKQSPEGVADAEREAEKQVEGTAASFSASVGDGPGREMTDEDKARAQRRLELLDSFDYDTLRQAIQRDLLNNPDQRAIIEARLEPINIEELILKNRASQRVPIVPGKFEVSYTSMTGNDDLALKQLLMLESRSAEVTERYLLDKYAFMAITCGLTAINNNKLPPHLDNEDKFNEDLFMSKFEWVMKRPLHMLSSIGCNHTWFEMRIRRLFVAEKVGNT